MLIRNMKQMGKRTKAVEQRNTNKERNNKKTKTYSYTVVQLFSSLLVARRPVLPW